MCLLVEVCEYMSCVLLLNMFVSLLASLLAFVNVSFCGKPFAIIALLVFMCYIIVLFVS